jgi:hypothetical protein
LANNSDYELIPTRNIVFNFNTSGYEVLEKYNDTKNYCFDDLGIEPTGSHYAKECNVMGEILLSRYDLFMRHPQIIENRSLSEVEVKAINQQPITNNHSKTHLTTNLNAQEIEKRYGCRLRSRLRAMFNQIRFEKDTKDKRK